jgi:histidyl-tRNA synthetase
VPRGSYVVKVNNRKVLDGVMEAIGIGGEENAGKRLTVLRAVDKFDRLGQEGVKLLLGTGRKDESGDFTEGAGLTSEAADRLIDFVIAQYYYYSVPMQEGLAIEDDLWKEASELPNLGKVFQKPGTKAFFNNASLLNRLRELVGTSEVGNQGIEELLQIAQLAREAGYGSRRIRIDTSVVRGLEYYTGPVYEVELTLETKDEKGNPVRFGSVGGGGRYDGLVSRFRGEPVPATGFSIGVSRLQAALTLLGKLDNKPEPGPVVVTVFDRDRIADYQRMVSKLREAGIRAEMYLGSGKFGPQMKYADKRNSPCAVIQGGDEKLKNEVQIKDLILGATLTAIKDRDEYLKQQAEAQFAVPEDKLVDAVRQVLARHGVAWG